MPDGDKPTYPKKKLIIAIGLFAVVCGFIVLGATFTNGTQPEIESFESFNSDGEAGITGPSIEQTDNGDVQLTGQITTTGEDITVKNISHSGDEVVVVIGSNGSREESSEEHTISYEAEVSGLTGSETIRVKHENGEEYTMNVEDSITYDVELLSSSSGRQERAAVKVDGNSVVINGHIAANTGGQQPVINSVEVSDETLNVNVGTASDSDVVTQVVTSYEYKATVNNVPSSVQDVTVSHKGNTIVREQLGDESVDINSVESSSGSNEYSRITGWSEDTIELEGGIVSNTGGQSVSVTNTSLQDGKLTVTVDTDSGESVVTQVITTYSYNLTIDNSAEIETVEIKHTDGETYVYQEQNY